MSGPSQRPSFNSSDPSSPRSPQPRGNIPVSFRTNVNRAKTRRWVEAKKYSYDGDDWGEDEYGEYEYDDDHLTPQAQSAGANHSTPDIPSTLTKGTPHLPLSSEDQSHSVKRAQTIPTESPATPSNPPASIIRPADIYRRMREEQKAHQSVLVQPSTDQRTPATSTSVASPPTNNTPTETPESSAPLPVQHSGSAFEGKAGELNDSAATPITANEPPAISLPDVKRLSAFNPILPASELNPQGIQDPENQPHQLQHNPSLGFRSAVNQAFDVPETPSTVTDSIARSNSDSTTAISPIISRRDATDDKTPTIEEDPNENVNEGADTPTEANAVFKPGHRRDLSLPSPGNSPSRRPMITETNISASSDLAQISTGTPSESPQEAPPSTQQHSATTDSIQHRQEMSKRDLPAPLNVQTNVASGPTVTAEHVPVIIPSISAENSPEDTENDRLRKEIIRSLSRENTPSDQQDHDTPPQTGKQDNLTPREIQSSWNEPHGGDPSVSQLSGAAPNALQTASEAPPAVPAALSPAQDSQPALQRRFSWEEPSDDDNPTTVAQAQPQPPLIPGQDTLSPESIHPVPATAPTSQTSEAGDHIGGKDQPGLSEPKLTVVPPPVEDGVNIPSSSQAPGSAHSQTTEIPARTEDEQSFSRDQQSPELPAQAPSASFESGLLGFKDILNMQSSEERVKAFDRTRIQFAAIDTGLSNWVQVTVQSHPEHSDVVERNSKPLSDEFKNSVPRAKFPKLSSLGTLASSLQDGSHSSSGHTRRPSVPLGSTKQHQVGKDFLHTAGVLGGQAGKAAKGLFSKGRSKWKGSGGNEKGFQSSRGYHRPVRLSDIQPDTESSVDLEDPEDMHDTPSSRPRTTNQEGEFVAARGGDEDLVRRSTPTTSGQFTTQTGGQQRPPHASDPCLVERQGEPHQADRSRSSSKNWNADSQKFQDVEQSSAKPRDEYRPASAQSDENQDDKIIDSTSSLEREPRRQFRTQIHHDIPDRENFQGQQTGLRQLPSVSSLGAQEEADPILDPPPPLAQKLAQDPSSSQVSLPSDVGDSLPRYLGGRNWPRGGSNHLQSPLAQREAIQSQPERPPVRHNGRPSSTPRLLSPLSPQHDLSRRPEQSSSPRDRASHRISSSPMEKLKNVGRFRRISMGSNPPDFKTGQSPKTPFDRLAGFLGRQHRKSGPPEQVPPSPDNRSSRPHLVPAPPQPDSRVASPSISSFDNHERPVSLPNGRNTFNGQQPPPEGYFAHETPESFSAAQPHPHLRGTASAERMRLSDPTPLDPARLSPHHSPPYPSPPTPRRQPHVSSPRFSSPMPSPSPRTPPSRGRSEERTYAEELHLRSRSPKAFAPRPEERNLPKHDPTDPAFRLGAFRSSNPRTSRVGDQELPWKITIPGDSDETTLDPSASWRQETEGVLNGTRLPTYQEDAQEHGQHQYPQDEKRSPPPPNPRASLTDAPPPPPPHPTRPEHPHRPPARAMNSFDTPVELPVRADDDSSEEIMMSSTAYPGQEWRPAGYSGWGDQ